MANFTVRVELHAAHQDHYRSLHERLAVAQFFRVIEGGNDTLTGFWALPSAEYDHSAPASAAQVRDRVLAIAKAVKPEPQPWVLVSEVTDRAWSTEPVQGHVRAHQR